MTSPAGPKWFGTDGLRGVANAGVLAPERVLALGRALGRAARARAGEKTARMVVARDPRRSSPLLEAALVAGAASEGVEVIDLGVLPTPAFAILLPQSGAALGAMITASHNPMPDNGIKVLGADGRKLDDTVEAALEADMERPPSSPPPTGTAVGAIRESRDAVEMYAAALRRRAADVDLKGMTIVVDAANGAGSFTAPLVLERFGARVIAINASPDGDNINVGCGAVHPEGMAKLTKERGAHLGVALDGDADRAICAGSDGSLQDGDRMLFALGLDRAARGRLPKNAIVGTVMTNFGLELALKSRGIRLVRTPVGDRHVAVALERESLALGGEPSGHLIFGAESCYVGDGLFTAIAIAALMKSSGKKLEELTAPLAPVPQVLLNVRVRAKPPIEGLPRVADAMGQVERAISGRGRVLVRYSGTENLLRVMVEGEDKGEVERSARTIAAAVEAEIGA